MCFSRSPCFKNSCWSLWVDPVLPLACEPSEETSPYRSLDNLERRGKPGGGKTREKCVPYWGHTAAQCWASSIPGPSCARCEGVHVIKKKKENQQLWIAPWWLRMVDPCDKVATRPECSPPSPSDSWDGNQHPSHSRVQDKQWQKTDGWMDGWMFPFVRTF